MQAPGKPIHALVHRSRKAPSMPSKSNRAHTNPYQSRWKKKGITLGLQATEMHGYNLFTVCTLSAAMRSSNSVFCETSQPTRAPGIDSDFDSPDRVMALSYTVHAAGRVPPASNSSPRYISSENLRMPSSNNLFHILAVHTSHCVQQVDVFMEVCSTKIVLNTHSIKLLSCAI